MPAVTLSSATRTACSASVAAAIGAPIGYLGALSMRPLGLVAASAAAPGAAALTLATGGAATFGLLAALSEARGHDASDALEQNIWRFAGAQAVAGLVGAVLLQATPWGRVLPPLQAAAVGVAGVAAGLLCLLPLSVAGQARRLWQPGS